MSRGAYDPNAIYPIVTNINLSTSANGVVAVKTSTSLAVKFTLVAPPSTAMYLGNSSVSSTKGIPIAAGASVTFGPDKMIDRKAVSYDLGRFWLACTAASKVATLVVYGRSGGAGPF